MGLTDRDSSIAVVGLGSPIMCDDAVGLRVSQAIEDMHLDDVDCYQEAVGGLDILPVIHGYRMAIVVDAIMTGEYGPGTVLIFSEQDFDSKISEAASHDVNLPTAIKIGRQMDPSLMPDVIKFIAIEVEDIKTMTETMTPAVEAAVPSASRAVLHLMEEFRKRSRSDRSS
jgi:hydrogenase maturation protease